jgi:GntR family transcriptional regulator
MPLKPGPLPKHYQLTEILRVQIDSGALQVGQQLPSEEQLCREYTVSRGTARRAISTLVQEGLVRSEQGRGSFVSRKILPGHSFALVNFKQERQQNQFLTTHLLQREILPANLVISGRLGILMGDPVIHIVRLQSLNGKPVIHETRHLSLSLCPQLMDEDIENQSIHHLLVHKYQLPLVKTVHTLEARVLSVEQAHLMKAERDSAAFFVDRLTYTTRNGVQIPAVWYQAYILGDDYQFRVEFEAQS